MTTIIDEKAQNRWDKADVQFQNYRNFIKRKTNRFDLSIIDLLYVSNFKGGNGTIGGDEIEVNSRLKIFTDFLIRIDAHFRNKSIIEINDNLLNDLLNIIDEITNKALDERNKISGLGISYLSALLNIYFPELIPIIDRRVLINLEIVTNKDLDSQGQVKEIWKYYRKLIIEIRNLCVVKGKNIREVDREIFSKMISTTPSV